MNSKKEVNPKKKIWNVPKHKIINTIIIYRNEQYPFEFVVSEYPLLDPHSFIWQTPEQDIWAPISPHSVLAKSVLDLSTPIRLQLFTYEFD